MEVRKLSEKRTPYYLYDLELLEQTLQCIQLEAGKHANFHVHYAIKANANPLILNVVRKYGFGIDCVSGGEIERCLSAGFNGSQIVFAGVAKSDEEIKLGLQNNIFSFNVESLEELTVIDEIAEQLGVKANVCLRINPDIDAHTHANITTGRAENKFGLSKIETVDLIAKTVGLKHVTFRGLHFHIGSQILEMGDFKSLCNEINELQDKIESAGYHLEIINVGGGLGIDYVNPNTNPIPDFHAYFSTFADNLKVRDGQEVHFELGRSIVGQCGTLITKALYVKKGSVKQFVMVDAGMTDLIRPALYDAYHKIENLSVMQNVRLSDQPIGVADTDVYDVVGPICESSDIFVKNYEMPITSRGDILAIRSAGAYGEAMACTYNCRTLPKSYTLADMS